MADLLLPGLPAVRVNPGGSDGNPKNVSKTSSALPKKRNIQKRNGGATGTSFTLSRLIHDANSVVLYWRDGLNKSEREERRRTEERKQTLAARMQNARTMKEWETAASELDSLEGNDEWKLDRANGNPNYNPDFIEERLKELDEARTHHDIRAMLYLIRTALSRDLGGMGNVDLYRHSYIGTKRLIERYVDSATRTVESLVEQSAVMLPPGIENKELLENVLYARQSFGRSALLLSGGATFGMAHIGVLKAMFESHMLPRIISGASAGSIVCAVLCTRKDEEIPSLLAEFPYGDLAVFEGEDEALSDHIRRLLTEGSWSDIRNLTRVMRGILGDLTFQEAYNRTRRICNICVSSASIYELPRLLNYVTAPNVMIWSAVAASCSVPMVFNAAPLLVKDPATGAHAPWNPTPQLWIDGSVDNDLPMTRLAEMFNVNHFIVSQVNPHVVPFLSKDERLHPSKRFAGSHEHVTGSENAEWLHALTALAKDEALHRLHFMAELGILPNLFTKLRSILSQKYSGDITILPEIALQDLPRILKNPNVEFMERNCLIGERATWPKLSRIRDRCAIELALDRAVHALRARVVFSKSQVDLRRLVAGSESQTSGAIGASAKPMGILAVQHPSDFTIEELSKADEDPYSGNRRRRNSVGNVQLAVRRRKVLQNMDSMWTDDDTQEEERLEMRLRNKNSGGMGTGTGAGPGARTVNGNGNPVKPRLKRSARSHAVLPSRPMYTSGTANVVSGTGTGMGAAPDQAQELVELLFTSSPRGISSTALGNRSFDFAMPITPPSRPFRTIHSSNDPGYVMDEEAPAGRNLDNLNMKMSDLSLGPGEQKTALTAVTTITAVNSPRLDIVSPTEPASDDPDLHTSDADVEDSRTDESDTEPQPAFSSNTASTRHGKPRRVSFQSGLTRPNFGEAADTKTFASHKRRKDEGLWD